MPPADLDVDDLGFGDAGGAAAEAEDDLVGEAVGDLAGGVFAGVFGILAGDDLGVLDVLGVVEKAVDDELAADQAGGAERDVGGVDGGVGEGGELHLGLRAGCGGRHEGLRDDVEDAGVGEVGEEGGVEGLLEAGAFGGRRRAA